MSKIHVKTGDTVILLTGKDEYQYNDKDDKAKGRKTGKVVAVSPKEGKVIVEGFNVVTKHVKPTRMGQVGGMMKKFGYSNVMQIPKLEKVVVNVAAGEAKDNAKVIDAIMTDLAAITGQRPVVCRAKKSVANFKLREGMPIGVKVTLRGERMYEFVYKLFNVSFPRVRDFRGINGNSFDGKGNYSTGIKEQLIFPEIEYDKIDKVRGMDINFITTAQTDEEAKELLTLLGAPFAK